MEWRAATPVLTCRLRAERAPVLGQVLLLVGRRAHRLSQVVAPGLPLRWHLDRVGVDIAGRLGGLHVGSPVLLLLATCALFGGDPGRTKRLVTVLS